MARRITLFVLTAFTLAAPVFARDISQDRLNNVSLGMKTDDVLTILGRPELRRFEGVDDTGKPFEKLQYSVSRRRKEASANGDMLDYYACDLVFLDDKLVRVERATPQ